MYNDYSYHSLLNWYQEATEYALNGSDSLKKFDEVDFLNLFERKNPKNFIRNYIRRLTDTKQRNSATQKLFAQISLITDFRAKHTVSSFLLGIVVKNSLPLDMTTDGYSSYASFLYGEAFNFLWPVICLLHDIGYKYEYSSKIYATKYPTLDVFCYKNNIEFNLLEHSERAELMRNYYLMRISGDNGKCKVDHGITGAVLLYDSLMTFYKYFSYVHTDFSIGMSSIQDFHTFALQVAEVVALHNMWIASEETVDMYRKYNLHELIVQTEKGKLFFQDNNLRFLLGLIDTIDPIKGFCNSEGGKRHLQEKDVLQNLEIRFPGYDKKMEIYFANDMFKDYCKKLKDLEDWMGVSVDRLDEYSLFIAITQKSNSRKKLNEEMLLPV